MSKTKNQKQKATLLLGWEFIKLQIAGNIPFWGTYIINFLLDEELGVNKYQALLVATVLANVLFLLLMIAGCLQAAKETAKHQMKSGVSSYS